MMLPTVFLFFWLVGKQFDHYAINRYADCLEKVKFGSATKRFCKWSQSSSGHPTPTLWAYNIHVWNVIFSMGDISYMSRTLKGKVLFDIRRPSGLGISKRFL